MALSPAERTARARLAAHVLHSKVDSREHTRPAREAFERRFLDQVDPNRELPEAERNRRAGHARAAYYQKLSFQAQSARRARREAAALAAAKAAAEEMAEVAEAALAAVAEIEAGGGS